MSELFKYKGDDEHYFIKTKNKHYTGDEVVDLLNEQQATITNLQGDVNRLQYIIDELRKDNYKRFEKINELKAKLKEKEEENEQLRHELDSLTGCYCADNKEFKDYWRIGYDD